MRAAFHTAHSVVAAGFCLLLVGAGLAKLAPPPRTDEVGSAADRLIPPAVALAGANLEVLVGGMALLNPRPRNLSLAAVLFVVLAGVAGYLAATSDAPCGCLGALARSRDLSISSYRMIALDVAGAVILASRAWIVWRRGRSPSSVSSSLAGVGA